MQQSVSIMKVEGRKAPKDWEPSLRSLLATLSRLAPLDIPANSMRQERKQKADRSERRQTELSLFVYNVTKQEKVLSNLKKPEN
jgi:hypothetical protein